MPVTIQVKSREPASPGFRRFGVSPEAAAQGQGLGIPPDTLAGYARRAARYKDPSATHRFKDLAFVLTVDTVVAVWQLDY